MHMRRHSIDGRPPDISLQIEATAGPNAEVPAVTKPSWRLAKPRLVSSPCRRAQHWPIQWQKVVAFHWPTTRAAGRSLSLLSHPASDRKVGRPTMHIILCKHVGRWCAAPPFDCLRAMASMPPNLEPKSGASRPFFELLLLHSHPPFSLSFFSLLPFSNLYIPLSLGV